MNKREDRRVTKAMNDTSWQQGRNRSKVQEPGRNATFLHHGHGHTNQRTSVLPRCLTPEPYLFLLLCPSCRYYYHMVSVDMGGVGRGMRRKVNGSTLIQFHYNYRVVISFIVRDGTTYVFLTCINTKTTLSSFTTFFVDYQ